MFWRLTIFGGRSERRTVLLVYDVGHRRDFVLGNMGANEVWCDEYGRRSDCVGEDSDAVAHYVSAVWKPGVYCRCHSSTFGGRRRSLVSVRSRLAATRRRLEALVGLTARRGLGAVATDCSRACNFSRQSVTFFGWSRNRSLLRTSSPSPVIRRR